MAKFVTELLVAPISFDPAHNSGAPEARGLQTAPLSIFGFFFQNLQEKNCTSAVFCLPPLMHKSNRSRNSISIIYNNL